ncbi:hypothetical protein NL882_001241 [Listeria monocytogenes]|nr:hypothetical protein [Listeria monocytogenes]
MATIKKSQVREAINEYQAKAIEEVTKKHFEKKEAFRTQILKQEPELNSLYEAFKKVKQVVSGESTMADSLFYGCFRELKAAPVCNTFEEFESYIKNCIAWWSFPGFSELEHAYESEKSEIYNEYDKVRELMKSIPSTQKCIAELEKIGFDLSDLKPEVTKAVAIIEVDKTKLGLVKKDN